MSFLKPEVDKDFPNCPLPRDQCVRYDLSRLRWIFSTSSTLAGQPMAKAGSAAFHMLNTVKL